MKKVLFIGYVWPEPATTAAGHRMLQLLIFFTAKDYSITFASTAQQTPYTTDLAKLGVKTKQILLNHSSFDDFIKDLQPNIVVFDRFMIEEQFGWRVAEFAPTALRILNTEDLHSLRQTREACHKKQEDFSIALWKQKDTTKREIASVYRSDLSLIISEAETKLLQNEFKISKTLLLTLPFLVAPISRAQQEKWPDFNARKDFIFVGNGKHAPNVDAVNYLKNTLWTHIRKELPNASLHIYGAYLPHQITQMHKPTEGFLVKGWLQDLDTTMQKARINLAPLRFGAGIKGKVIDGMRNGTPTLTTTIGAEGIPGFISFYDNEIEFARQAANLYTNKESWLKTQQYNLEILATHFSKETLQNKLAKTLSNLQKKLAQHRSQNFIGTVLQHQSMASTKFMSKWIEEKNKGG